MNSTMDLSKVVTFNHHDESFKSIQTGMIKHFKGLITQPDEEVVDRAILSQFLELGIILDPRASKNAVKSMEKMIHSYYGRRGMKELASTLYTSWSDIENATSKELFYEQILHYMLGLTYNTQVFTDDKLNQFIMLRSFTLEEVYALLEQRVASGAALTDDFLEFAILCVEYIGWLPQNVSNRAFKARLISKGFMKATTLDEIMEATWYSIYPMVMTKHDYRRFLEWEHSKDQVGKSFDAVLANNYDYIDESKLVRDCNRWRKILLLIRRVSQCKSKINRLLRLSKTGSKPKKATVLDTILSPYHTLNDVSRALQGATIYRLVRLYNYINECSLVSESENFSQIYSIRNGKSYLKSYTSKAQGQRERIALVKKLVEEEFKGRFLNHNLAIYRKGSPIQLLMPTTEKSKVGEYPDMSYVKIPHDEKLMVGISWGSGNPKDNGVHFDLDLHAYEPVGGYHIGWNSYNEGRDQFSGDMVRLSRTGYATEWIYTEERLVTYNYSTYSIPQDLKPYEEGLMSVYLARVPKSSGDMVNKDDVYTSIRVPIMRGGDSSTLAHMVEHEEERFVTFSLGRIGGRVPNKELAMSINGVIMRKIKSKMTLEQFATILSIPYITKEEDLATLPEGTKIIDLNDEVLTFDAFIELMSYGEL